MVIWNPSFPGMALNRQSELRRKYSNDFANDSDEELERTLKDLHEHTEELKEPQEVILAKHNHPHFIKSGVFDAIVRRKGIEYACNVINISTPNGLAMRRMKKCYVEVGK